LRDDAISALFVLPLTLAKHGRCDRQRRRRYDIAELRAVKGVT